MKKLLALLLAVVMIVALVACNGNTTNQTDPDDVPGTTAGGDNAPDTTTAPTATKYGGHLNFTYESEPENLDPQKSTGVFNYMWTSLVWEPPLTRDAEGNIRPNVCEFELSDDQLTLKLWVREGMTFHDGSAVEIEDVIASIKRSVHKSPRSYVLPYIADVTYEGEVATITFNEYNERTMYYIACPNAFLGVMPKEIAEKYSYESGEIITTVADAIGTGPYKVTELDTGVSISFERYEDYIPVAEGYTGFASPKMAYLDSITFWAKGDQNTGNIALMNGQYDLSEGVASDYYAQLEQAGIVNDSRLALNTLMLEFNTYSDRLVSTSADMRKAILAAIDVPELVEVAMYGRYETYCCPTTDEIYYTDVFETADYMGEDNIELSKKYQQAAGYNGEEILISYTSGYLEHYTLICSYLDAAGIKYKAEMLESEAKEELHNNTEGAWDIDLGYPSIASSPGLLSATIMDTNYQSAEKQALMDKLTGLMAGTDEYKQTWFELADQIVDDAAIAFLGQANLVWSMDPDFNLDFQGMNTYLFNSYWDNPADHPKK